MKNKCISFIIQCLDRLHIPFPAKYSFIVLSSHGSGHNALWVFLQKCKVKLFRVFMLRNSYTEFCWQIYKGLFTLKRDEQMALAFSEDNFEGEDKIYAKITRKVPALMLVRDPISVLRSLVNLYRFWNHEIMIDNTHQLTYPKAPYCIGFDMDTHSMTHTHTQSAFTSFMDCSHDR